MLTLALAAAGLTLAGSVHAADNDLTAKVPPAGLRLIGDQLPKVLPKSYLFSGLTYGLGSCSSTLTVPSTTFQYQVQSVSISPKTGKLQVDLVVTAVKGSIAASVNKLPVICIGGFSCTGNVAVTKASATATFSPTLVGGKIKLQQPTIDVQVNPGDVSLSLSSCGVLGSVANALLNSTIVPQIKSWIVSRLVSLLQKLALTNLPPEIEKALASFTSYGGQLQGFKVFGQLKSLGCATSGLSASAVLDLTVTDAATCQLPPAPTPSPVTGTPSLSFSGEHLGVAASRALITEAILAAWKSGMLCLPQSKLASLGVPTSMFGVAGLLLGLTSVDGIDVNAPNPPQVSLVSGKDARLDITAPGFEIVISGKGPSGSTVVTVTLDAVLHAVLGLDPVDRALVIASLASDINNVNVSATSSQGLNLSPGTVTTLLTTVVLPLVQKQVEGTQLVPHVMHNNGGVLDSYYLYLVRAQTSASFVQLYAKLFEKPAFDSTRPDTTLEQAPAPLVAPQTRL